MKTIIGIVALIALVIFAILSVKWAMDRSRSDKTNLQRSFQGQRNPDDNLSWGKKKDK